MEPTNKQILEQFKNILYFKIKDCYEHIKVIEDNEEYMKLFLHAMYERKLLNEDDMTRYKFVNYDEADLLYECRNTIKGYEKFKEIIENEDQK